MIGQRIKKVAVIKVTLVDSPEKMRPQKTPTEEYSMLMGANLRISSTDASAKPNKTKADLAQ